MKKRNVVMIRSNPVKPYPRLEKSANALAVQGYNVHVLAWDRDSNYPQKTEVLRLQNCSVPITRIGIASEFSAGIKKNFIPLIKFQIFIYRWLKQNRDWYDIIHAYDFDTGYTAKYCAMKFNKRLVYDIPDYYVDSHGLKGSKIGLWVKKNEDAIINYADATIICTEKRKEQIADATPKKLAVIHNTPYDKDDYGEIHFAAEFDKKKLKIAYIGIFGKARFIDKIVEVIAKRNDCELHIAGYGANMEEYLRNMSLQFNNIKYYGKVDYNTTLYIEHNCDVLCAIYDPNVPNHRYAAPNKFYEALMLGKPLIVARDTGVDDIISKNNIGIVIDYNETDFDKALDCLIRRKAEWDDMGKRARRLYDTKYSLSVMEKRLIKLYTEIEEENNG